MDIRDEELKVLKKASYFGAFTSFLWLCAPFLVAVASFAVYVLSDPSHVLTPTTAFVSLSLFNILRFPMTMLPMLITFMVQVNQEIFFLCFSIFDDTVIKFLCGKNLNDVVVRLWILENLMKKLQRNCFFIEI